MKNAGNKHQWSTMALALIQSLWTAGFWALVTAIISPNMVRGQNLPPVLLVAPAFQTVAVGHPAFLWVNVVPNSGSVSYQWKFGTNNIPGANDATFSIASVKPTDAGTYSVIATTAFGTVTSAAATLIVRPPSPLDLWTPVNSGANNNLFAVAGSPSALVAVGASGTLATSTNGLDWSTQISGVTNNLNAIVYGDGLFVAGGDAGMIVTSADGVSWSSQRSNTTNAIFGLAFGNRVFVGVGVGGLIVTSSDGAEWSVQPSTTTEDINNIVFGNGTFAATGFYPFSLASTNGIDWTPPNYIIDLKGAGPLAFGGGIFATFGFEDYITSVWDVSANSVNWTGGRFRDGNSFMGITRAAAFGNGEFVVAANTTGPIGPITLDSVEAAMLRTDAATETPPAGSWSTFVFRQQLATNIQSLAFWRSRFVAVGESGAIYISGTLPPYLSHISQSGNSTSVSMEGIPLESYVLESAAKVSGAWQPVATNTTSVDGKLTFTGPTPSDGGSRFYRVSGP